MTRIKNMQYNRFLPLLTPFFVWLLLEFFFFKPGLVYVIYIFIALIYFFTARQFVLAGRSEEKWWNFIILPINFTAGVMIFCSFLPSQWLVQLLFVLNLIFLYIYWRTIYYYLVKTDAYEKKHLENIANYGNFLAFFFVVAGIYGLQSFLNLPTWALMVVLLLVSGLTIYHVFWSNRIVLNIGLFYILVISLILVELAWSASFLTLSYYILGLVIAICYYALSGLARLRLTSLLDKRTIRLYLITSGCSIIIILLTARWL